MKHVFSTQKDAIQRRSSPLRACVLALAAVLAAVAYQSSSWAVTSSRIGGGLRDVRPEDKAFLETVQRIPELIIAEKLTFSDGMLRRVEIPNASAEQLDRLARALLRLTSPDEASSLSNAEPRPILNARAAKNTEVWLHSAAGVPVANSMIVARHLRDGSVEVLNALIPVAKPPKNTLTLSQAWDRARVSPSLKARGMTPDEIDAPVGDAYYILSQDGFAHLVYRMSAKGSFRYAYVDAISGEVVNVERRSVPADFDNSDLAWTNPPATYFGFDSDNGDKVFCTLLKDIVPTDYYGGPYILNPVAVQANINGPAQRVRYPDLGLTAIKWRASFSSFESVFLLGDFEYFRDKIFQSDAVCKDNPSYVFDDPIDFNNQPITGSQSFEYMELQTSIEDIQNRFGWGGLHDDFSRLILALDMEHSPDICSISSDDGLSGEDWIQCAPDRAMSDSGAKERIAPIEVFAHEFAHSIVRDRGLKYNASWEHAALSEALSDIFGLSVKALHMPNQGGWRIADQPDFLQFNKEWLCVEKGEYCNKPPPGAWRNIGDPKSPDDSIQGPGPNYYNGTNFSLTWGRYHTAGLVVSHMLYLMSEGSKGGFRDDDPTKGLVMPFYGIGFQSMLEIFYDAMGQLPLVSSSPKPMKEYADSVWNSAEYLCGSWSSEEFVAQQAAWVVNLTDVPPDWANSGYEYPSVGQQDVPPIVGFRISGLTGKTFDYQISKDKFFGSIDFKGSAKRVDDLKDLFVVKLKPNTKYWWRVREADAEMLKSKWVPKDLACWRPAGSFMTGAPAVVTDATPADGDQVEPWLGEFSWTAGQWAGYELWVDDLEPPGGRYKKVWAHRIMLATDFPEYKESKDPKSLTLKPGALPLPKDRDLCWKIVGFVYDSDGNRLDSDPVEHCFHTLVPQTVITYPPPPDANGKLASAPGQPLSVDYDPADGTEHHEFSLEVTKLSGQDPPSPTGVWAYVDDPAHDKANIVQESLNAVQWTSRTRERMLPAELDAAGYMTYSPDIVHLKIKSFSPAISSPLNGGTYPEKIEDTTAEVDFHLGPSLKKLTPSITTPWAVNRCSSSQSTELKLVWNHGQDATPDLVSGYGIRLYPEHCSGSICATLYDPNSEKFAQSLAFDELVERNQDASQEYTFSRATLFPDETSEMNGVTGFLVHLYGVSGAVPGPEGLNITGEMLVDLPVLPATLDADVSFDDGGPNHPEWAKFFVGSLANKNSANPLRPDTYNDSYNHTVVRAYKGASCAGNPIASNEVLPDSGLTLFLSSTPELQDDPHPVISAQAELSWGAMSCPVQTSNCVTLQGSNPSAKPDAVSGLTAQEQPGVLGVSWNPPGSDPNPAALEYHVMVTAVGNDPSNILVNQPPAEAVVLLPDASAFGSQIGLPNLALLAPADVGKNVVLHAWACRQGTNKCSAEALITYQIGSAVNNPSTIPEPPINVAIHVDDPDAEQAFEDALGFDPGSVAMWTTVSWDAPPSGTAPTYYLTTFYANDVVTGALPSWFNVLQIPGVAYGEDASAYSGVVRASANGVVVGATAWGQYVWPLAETYQAGPPSSGVAITTTVRACSGAVPVPPGKQHEWVLAPNIASCSAAVPVSLSYP